jgi:DNA adenine methylase
MVRDAVGEVIDRLQALERGHRAGGSAHFYKVRDEGFNPVRQALQGHPEPSSGYSPELAAMLIYLNRTGYNGLFRVNSRGAFNVPAGRYDNVRICDASNLERLADALRRPGLTLQVARFEEVLAGGGSGDFVYLDPPYAPLSRTAQFTSYTAVRFGLEEQAHLQRRVIELASRGAHVLLSNSVAPEIRKLYKDSAEARSAGLITRTVPARRAINSEATKRGAIREYLITNVR